MIKHAYLTTLFNSLNEHKVKYTIVGGLAVNFHGYQRFTRDVDLIVSLKSENLKQLVKCLKKMSFKPIHPVSLEDYMDDSIRAEWSTKRNMTVFSVTSDLMPSLTLDLFVSPPYSYESIEEDLLYADLDDGVHAATIDINRLIEMKRLVGRDQDVIDVEHLTKLKNELKNTPRKSS